MAVIENHGRYVLEAEAEGGAWTSVVVYPNGGAAKERFEIGEPVYLKSIRIKTSNYDVNKVWWIQGFDHARGEAKVFITTMRGGCPGELGIPLGELEKLPAMLRIAVEAS